MSYQVACSELGFYLNVYPNVLQTPPLDLVSEKVEVTQDFYDWVLKGTTASA